MGRKSQLVIFTDLDGTLLDHENYSWKAAIPALEAIQEYKIPLIFCSSKTRAEIEPLRKSLKNVHPFIVENGGGVFVPEDYFPVPVPLSAKMGRYKLIELGTPYRVLRKALTMIREELGEPIKGYGDMSAQEVAALTGLPLPDARLAQKREYDEPFIIESNEASHQKVLDAILSKGLHWTRGGRFYHLSGPHDKGKGVGLVSKVFQEIYRQITTVALGDSDNDLPMLSAVEKGFIVQKPDESYLKSTLGNVKRAQGIGPAGWNRTVLSLVKAYK